MSRLVFRISKYHRNIKYLWHPFIWKVRRTNGGNGYVGHIMRKGRLSLGVFLSKNYGLVLVLLIVRTLMNHYQKLSKKAPYEIITKSLRGWAIRLVDDPKSSYGYIYGGIGTGDCRRDTDV